MINHRKRIAEEYGEPWRDVVKRLYAQKMTTEAVCRVLGVRRNWLVRNFGEDLPVIWQETHMGLTRRQWAEKLGITVRALHMRIRRHGWEKALAMRGPAR